MSDPDSELMLRVKSGEEGAFARLVDRFLRPLVAFFHRLGADASFAEDCAQEVFVKILRARLAYEVRAKFSTYLFSVARHHWIDVVRHRAAGPGTFSGDAPDAGAEGAEGTLTERHPSLEDAPEARAERAELAAALQHAVETLSPEHREAFALAQVEGLRYEEIGEILGVPVGTVKSRVHTAVHLLRERLARAGFEP